MQKSEAEGKMNSNDNSALLPSLMTSRKAASRAERLLFILYALLSDTASATEEMKPLIDEYLL